MKDVNLDAIRSFLDEADGKLMARIDSAVASIRKRSIESWQRQGRALSLQEDIEEIQNVTAINLGKMKNEIESLQIITDNDLGHLKVDIEEILTPEFSNLF